MRGLGVAECQRCRDARELERKLGDIARDGTTAVEPHHGVIGNGAVVGTFAFAL